MLRTNKEIEREAVAWLIRLKDADEEDWASFTAWLEASPAHAAAYDEVALADEDAGFLSPILSEPPQRISGDNPVIPAAGRPALRHGRRAVLGWAVAASLVLFTGYATLAPGGTEVVETGPGERRQIALNDGTRIDLNGGTRLVLDEDRPRFAKLERGEALFHVVHDESRPFEVEAGTALLRDAGTVFNVVLNADRLDVAVSEGAVIYNPGRQETANLSPGMTLRKEAQEKLSIGRLEPASIGVWREGRLVYSGAPAAQVATDLGRNLGIPVEIASGVADRRFSGVIMLEGDTQTVLQRTSALLGLTLQAEGDGWILTKARARH